MNKFTNRSRFAPRLRNVVFAAVAATAVALPGAGFAEENKKGFAQTQMEAAAKTALKKLALKVAPDIMDAIGLGEVWTFFMGAGDPAPIDYSKIGSIVADELNKHDYALAKVQGLAQLEADTRAFGELTTPSLRDPQSMLDHGLKLSNIYDRLGAVTVQFAPYKVETIYARTAIDTLRMKTYALMAFDRRLHSGYNARTMETTVMDMIHEYIDLRNNMAKARYEKIQCFDDHVVDTMNSNLRLSPPQGGYCTRLTEHLRAMVTSGTTQATAYCEDWMTLRAVEVPDQNGNMQVVVPEQHICTEAGVKVGNPGWGDWRVFNFDGNGDNMNEARAKASELSGQLGAIHADIVQREAHAAEFLDFLVDNLLEATRFAQRKFTIYDGPEMTDFALANNTGVRVDVLWHGRDGKTQYFGSIGPGETLRGGRTSKHHWFGVYYTEKRAGELTGRHDNDGFRPNLICNFQFREGETLHLDSLDVTRSCELADAIEQKPVKKIDDHILHHLADGTETYSVGMPLEKCIQTCKDTHGCTMIRVNRDSENDCLMGRHAGEDDIYDDMYSYSVGGMRQYYVLAD